jgi:predicted enzyme related to lactoylglutathione lyase
MPSSSLIGQLPLAAIWFRCKNVEESKKFYGKVLGLKQIEHEVDASEKGANVQNGGVHFDLGTIRLSLIPKEDGIKNGKSLAVGKSIEASDQLVFVVENSIDVVQADLIKRGVKMKSKRVIEDSLGKAAWFSDPDGHTIYLWQPPRRESKNFQEVKKLVDHYESVTRALADLREIDGHLDAELEQPEKQSHSPARAGR